MAPQVLEQMAPCSLVSVPISCGAQGKDSDFYDGPFPHPSDGASMPQHLMGFLGEFDETISVFLFGASMSPNFVFTEGSALTALVDNATGSHPGLRARSQSLKSGS